MNAGHRPICLLPSAPGGTTGAKPATSASDCSTWAKCRARRFSSHHYLFSFIISRNRAYKDFADWVSSALQEEGLAERWAAIDLLAMTSIRELREAMLSAIRNHLAEGGVRRQCPPGSEFHFCEAKSFIMPTGLVARDAAEFFEQVGRVSNACLHFHLFESRLRLEQPTNDFSQWLKGLGETRLAKKIDKLDPYVITLGELKGEIVKLGRKYRRK
jgi:hypothetical protein